MELPQLTDLSKLDKKKLCDLKEFLLKYIGNIDYELRQKPI